MTVVKHFMCGCIWVMASFAHAEPLLRPTTIDWLLDCPLTSIEHLNAEVLARTQCGIVTVPRNHAAPHQGRLRLYVTRVGARQPLSREGIVFTQAGNTMQKNHAGTFAIQLVSRWETYHTPAYRTLLDRYDVIELSPRDLHQEHDIEQAAQDMEYLRTQLGDAQLHYLADAAATRLGTRYSALFPEHVARMVLVNPAQDDQPASLVDQLHLKDTPQPGANGCVNQWVGNFLAYGKQPPRSTRCLVSNVWR